MLLIKVILLIKYSYEKIVVRKIVLNFGSQNWLWKLKMSDFSLSSIKRSYKISKNSLRMLFGIQTPIEFHRTTKKFHNCHHTNEQPRIRRKSGLLIHREVLLHFNGFIAVEFHYYNLLINSKEIYSFKSLSKKKSAHV